MVLSDFPNHPKFYKEGVLGPFFEAKVPLQKVFGCLGFIDVCF